MKTIIALLLLGSASLNAEPKFVGVLTMGPRAWFAVADEKDGAARWLTIGQALDGYRVVSYVAEEQALIVEHDGRRTSLRLPAAKIAKADPDFAELLAIARLAIQSRDKWTSGVRVESPQPYGDDYRILIRRDETGEARLITITKQGAIRDYWKV